MMRGMVTPLPTRSILGAVNRWRLMLGAVSRTLVATLALSAAGLVGIANWEQFIPKTYTDSAGVPTIGYGTTEGVKAGQTITPERALVKLLDHVDKDSAAAVRRCVKVPLYQHEFDAYVALTYNIGAARFCNSAAPDEPPNLIDLINDERYSAACDRILAFDKARNPRKWVVNPKTGKREHPLEPLRGLTLRRQAERRTCIGDAANAPVISRPAQRAAA